MEIPAIKQKLPIQAVLSHYGLHPDRNGRLHCPFHPDKTPSMQIYPKTGTFSCFSTNCQAGTGDQIQFIELMEKCSKHEALVKAAELAGQYTPLTPEITPDKKPAIGEGDLLVREAVLARLFGYFKKALPLTSRAVDYLKSRSLDYSKHEVGYNGGDWHQQLKEKHFIKSAERYGLLKAGAVKGYKTWGRDSVIFPLKDKQNRIISLYGRSITNDSDQRHFYLSGREGLYPGYPQSSTAKLILTESVIDAASLMQQTGIMAQYSVLALYGTNGLTQEHITAIRDLRSLREIILVLDGDEAGEAATIKHSRTLQALLPTVRITRTVLPEGEDVNSVLESHDDPGVLSHLVESRRDFSFSTEEKSQAADSSRPAAVAAGLDTRNGELLVYDQGVLRIEILGGIRLTGLDRLRVTLKITCQAKASLPLWHSLDLYHHAQRQQLSGSLSEAFDLSAQVTAAAVGHLTEALEHYRGTRIEALQAKAAVQPGELTAAQREAAIVALKKENLLEHTNLLIGQSGISGEDINRLVTYLVYTTRKQACPLQVMLLGSSGSGKTWLQEKVSELIPEQDRIQITQITGNALYYFGRRELTGKLILIEDLEGAMDVFYPLRELQTKRRISKTVTLKDSRGNLRTITLTVEGPVCVSSCTTKEKLYEDNANRCILLYTDGSAEQDERIAAYQARVSAGAIDRHLEESARQQLQHMQQMLRAVVNPYAGYIRLPDTVFRPRRTMSLLLGFIEAITFYHQYQREVKRGERGEPYITTTPSDIAAAFTLLKEVLFAKSDELTGASRRFLEYLKTYLKREGKGSFTAREVRVTLRIHPSSLKRYVTELEHYGYLKGVGNRYRSYEYTITRPGEYDELKSGIDTHFNSILEQIHQGRERFSGSVVVHQGQ